MAAKKETKSAAKKVEQLLLNNICFSGSQNFEKSGFPGGQVTGPIPLYAIDCTP